MSKDVALFITCLTDQFYPRVGLAVTGILQHLGCKVHFPPGQTCCGQPHFNDGYHPQARELAKHFIEVFEPYEFIVTPSPSCCATVRRHYPQLLHGDHAWEPGCAKVAANTYEFGQFLQTILKFDVSTLKLPTRQTITCHTTCQQRHLAGLPPTALLSEIGRLDLRPLERADQCCGFGGAFAVKYAPLSAAIAEDKVRCIAATGADTVICNEAGCSLNISGMAHRKKVDVRPMHMAELIAEAMGIM